MGLAARCRAWPRSASPDGCLRDRIGLGGGTTVAPPTGPVVSLAVLPFRNASGDPTLDSLGASLSQVLSSELGQSSRVRTVPADRLTRS